MSRYLKFGSFTFLWPMKRLIVISLKSNLRLQDFNWNLDLYELPTSVAEKSEWINND